MRNISLTLLSLATFITKFVNKRSKTTKTMVKLKAEGNIVKHLALGDKIY